MEELSEESYWHDVEFKPDGSMSCGVWYLEYYPPFDTICLDGHFDIAELERIIEHMKKVKNDRS